MKLSHGFKIAIMGLRANKSRTLLTILGIVIGIASIILIMSLGSGAQHLILSQVQGLGSNTVAVIPGRQPSGPSDFAQIFSDSLKEKDLTALKQKSNVPTAKEIMPVVFGAKTSSFENETYRLTIFGVTDIFQKIFNITPAEGTFFSEEDVRSRANVVVIGSKVQNELFGSSEALGRRIKINNRTFQVIGILPKKGQSSFFNFDEMAIMPYTTAQQYILGIKYFHRFIVEADSQQNIERTATDIKLTLRESHNITDPAKDDFFVQTQADLAASLEVITSILTLFLVSVASISLLVGGVGIMNIMLVAVTERTREIGLRKALGATEKNILTQFLIEAITLTSIGGIVGILIGAFLSFSISLLLSRVLGVDWQFVFPWSAAVIGLVVAGSVGLIFGLYPARQASRKDPIEALRYE